MKILFLGPASGTTRHRQAALERLGMTIEIINPVDAFASRSFANWWVWHAGGAGMEAIVRRFVLSRLQRERYDLCIVDPGDLVGAGLLRALRDRVGRLVHFSSDNPFVSRDGPRWRIMLKALAQYDLFVTPRITTSAEHARRGLRSLLYVHTADEVVHRPRPETDADRGTFGSEVAFVGTWMPERGPFMIRLLDAGIDIRIFGANWHKAAEYDRLKPYVVLPHMLGDEDYVRSIQYARIALGFVSSGNLDLHTKRSVEVPAIGTLLCARRTSQHLELYREDEQAVFWEDADECAAKCRALLDNPERIATIAAAGARHQRQSRHWNEPLMARIVDEALALAPVRQFDMSS